MTNRIAVYLAAAVACGCGGRGATRPAEAVPTAEVASGSVSAPRAGAATEAEAAAMAAAMRDGSKSKLDYKVSAADLIAVTVYEVPEMNRRVRVNASGQVFLPLVGAVDLGGKSMGAAQSLIEKKLAAYVVKPQVTLFIEEYGNRRISVMGEVQRPGTYAIPTESRMTILEAISTAGGFTPVAAQDKARVLRYVNGSPVKYTIDVRNLAKGENKEEDMVLEPNDVVFVPQSLF